MTLGAKVNAAANRASRKLGSAVTFTHASHGTYDATTDTYSGAATTTVVGYAVQNTGVPERYQALGLVESETRTLFFTPTTYGSLPALGDSVSWGGITFTVREISPVSADGTAISANVIVSR